MLHLFPVEIMCLAPGPAPTSGRVTMLRTVLSFSGEKIGYRASSVPRGSCHCPLVTAFCPDLVPASTPLADGENRPSFWQDCF